MEARYLLGEDQGDTEVVGVIYNGETVCGVGKAEAFTPHKHKHDGKHYTHILQRIRHHCVV